MIRPVVAALSACALVVAVSALGMQAADAAVPAASTVALTVNSMPGGGDVAISGQREFDSTNSALTVADSGGSLAITAPESDGGIGILFELYPGEGASRFALGYSPASSNGGPGLTTLWVAANGESCAGTGGIDVRDIAYSGDTITRLDLAYQMYCDAVQGQTNEAGDFGELLIGEPQQASILMGARTIEFSPVPVGAKSFAVPVVIGNRGSSAVAIGTPSVTGSNPGAFAITANTCAKTLPAHKDCSISVQFVPHVGGARTAHLAVPVAGVSRSVELDATTFVGSSVFTAITGGGRVPGSGTNYSFTDANAVFGVSNDAANGLSGISGEVNDDSFELYFAGPGGAMPQVGTYTTGPTPGNGVAASMFVYGPGSGCVVEGTFTVKQAVYTDYGMPGNQFPVHLDIDYNEHCVGGTNTMSGEFAFDKVAAVTSPPPVTSLTATAKSGTVTAHWTNPTHTWAYTMLRVQPTTANDADAQPFSGTPVYSGTGTSATISGLTHGESYTISAFTVDAYGDVTGPTERTITP
jgi:hypothetical protein